MNPFVRDQITALRESSDPRDHAQATVMEMLSAQDDALAAIREQTTKTNGRVTKLESIAERQHGRISALEEPAGEIKAVCKVVAKAGAVAVACVGLVAGIMQIFPRQQMTPKEIKAIVDQAVADQKRNP